MHSKVFFLDPRANWGAGEGGLDKGPCAIWLAPGLRWRDETTRPLLLISQMALISSQSGANVGATLWSVVEACALGVPESKQLALSLWFFKRRLLL